MTAKQLLHELETVPHSARIRRMIELGRATAHDSATAALLATLEQGDFYERFLAIHSCFGSYDGGHVLRSLTDPSRIIRGTAISLTVLACNEEQLRQALRRVSRDGRFSLLWKLRHSGYETLIDEFLEHLAETNDLQLRKLLPCGSSTLVRCFIGRFQYRMDLTDWRRLARRHPTIAADLLHEKAASTPQLDLQLVAFVNGILPILAIKQPDHALKLVEALARTVPLHRLDLNALLCQRPAEMVDLVLRGEDLGEMNVQRIAHRLDSNRLLALIEKHFTTLEYHHMWLPYLEPETRLILYSSLAPLWRDRNGCLSPEIVALLPRTQREQEGRRHLALSALATRPEERIPYAAFLPWDEVYSLLDPLLHDPSEKIRTLAFHTLTQAVRYERSHVSDLLALVCTHLNEPDPVRGKIVDDLAELPKSIWRREHLETLEQIIQSIINAFDTSFFTVGALLLLITHLLPCAPKWSAIQFALVAQKHGLAFHYGCLKNRLSDDDVRQVGPTLRPLLLSWAEHGSEETLEHLVSLFSRQVRVFDALLDALELVLSKGKPSFQFGETILSTIVTYRPARAAQLLPELIQDQRDWITYPAVANYLQQHRQDLLTPFLTYRKYSGVFCKTPSSNLSSRRKRRIPKPLIHCFARWTSRQQATFARTLLRVINDETSDQQTIIRTITQLAAMPALPAKHLIALTNDPRPLVRDTALIHLGTLDTGEGIPVLQEALYDQRAVRALYALRPWFLTAPTQQALAILLSIPRTKVTIAKEVVRLLGEMPSEEAYQELLALDGQELHRNVRVALLRTLWHHLERDETWHILEREAQSTDSTIALSTAHLSINHALAKEYHTRKRFKRMRQDPSTLHQIFHFAEWNTITLTHVSGEHLILQAQQRLMHLSTLLLDHPEIEVRTAVLRGCTRLATADEGQALLLQLLKAVDSEQEDICDAAASAIFGTCIAEDAPHIGQAIQRLLPNRAALQTVLHAIRPELLHRDQFLPVVRAVLEALALDPLTIGLRVELAITFLPWDEVANLLSEAAATGILHADALERACNMLSSVLGKYGQPGRPDSKKMVRLEEALATHPNEYVRRIALAALITQAELPPGWDKERRARLLVYRADSSPLVAAAAQFTVLPTIEG